MFCPFPATTYQTPPVVWLTPQKPPISPVPEFVEFTVVPAIVCPQTIGVALQTKSFDGATGPEQDRHSMVDVPQDDAVPQDEFVL